MLTKHTIAEILRTNDRAVDRAMVVLYQRQTQDERASSTTKHHNRRGFTAAHASLGSYYGRWVLKGNRLTGRHLVRAREMALHYTCQLLDASREKAERTQMAA